MAASLWPLVKATDLVINPGAGAIAVSVLRGDANRLCQIGNGFVELAHLVVDQCTAVVRRLALRVDLNCLAVGRNRALEVALVRVGCSETVVSFGEPRSSRIASANATTAASGSCRSSRALPFSTHSAADFGSCASSIFGVVTIVIASNRSLVKMTEVSISRVPSRPG